MNRRQALSAVGAVLVAPGSLLATREAPDPWSNRLTRAIHAVETGGRSGFIYGDGGRALGGLQIHKACWIDALGHDLRHSGRWGLSWPGPNPRHMATWLWVTDIRYARRVFHSYCHRYHARDDESRARLWNAGPRFRSRMAATDRYWSKVKARLA